MLHFQDQQLLDKAEKGLQIDKRCSLFVQSMKYKKYKTEAR